MDVMHEAEALLGLSTPLQLWSLSTWKQSEYVDNFRTFSKKRGPALSPLDAPMEGQEHVVLSVQEGDAPGADAWATAVAASAAAPFDDVQAHATAVHEVRPACPVVHVSAAAWYL
jgi:hypothetical protein